MYAAASLPSIVLNTFFAIVLFPLSQKFRKLKIRVHIGAINYLSKEFFK